MAAIAKIDQGKIELPQEALNVLRVNGDDSLSVELNPEDGSITLRKIDSDQAWYWTPEWQAGEREADQDIEEGRFERYYSDEDFLKSFV